MTVNEFFENYEGLWVETISVADNATRDQCVDLFILYNQKVVNGPLMQGNAVDYWEHYPIDFYDRIPNTPEGVPQLGDVIIWGTKYGPYGHIAVCTDIADTKGFTSFDQNDPFKSRCHFQPHTYTGVLGWLRPKSLPTPPDPMKVKIDLKDPWGVREVQSIISELNDLSKGLTAAQEKGKVLDGFVSKWVEEWKLTQGSSLVDVENEMSRLVLLEDRIQEYRDSIEKCVGEFTEDQYLLKAHSVIREQIEFQAKEIADLQKKLSESKAPKGYKLWRTYHPVGLLVKLYKKEG